jgi:cytochrome c-type biogenesis protein CcmH/NrfG
LLLARARALDPADIETHMVSGLLAFRTGRYPAAVDHLSHVVERSAAYSMAHYRRVGDAEKARHHFGVYQRAAPGAEGARDRVSRREVGCR